MNHIRLSFVVASGLLIGVIAGAVAGYSLRPSAPSQTVMEAVAPHGHGSIAAYHNDGSLFVEKEIDNALIRYGQNAIASCASGLSATPTGMGCSNWTSSIVLIYGGSTSVPATNSLLPSGCTPTGALNTLCTGWKAEATFEITTAIDVEDIEAQSSAGQPFDLLLVYTSIHLDPGDRLIVTITFSIPA